MVAAPARPRRFLWLCGVLLIAAVAGSVAYWFRPQDQSRRRARADRDVAKVQRSTANSAVPERAASPREVCRELIRTHSGTVATASKPPSNHQRSVTAHLDNRPDISLEFARDIRPLLADHCYRCHGPDRQEGGIRFDHRETAFRVAESGVIPVISGDPVNSALLARITAEDPAERMPPDTPPLPDEVILQLRRWISSGADWPEDAEHWAFVAPQASPPPTPIERDWSRNVVDDFVAVRREAEGLPHAEEADRATLIRRLSLDLTGLPPTPEEVDDFAADAAPDAYDRLVDRLMASPHFGEKWAIRWLDLARYADTNGFEFDAQRTMWLYRDWLIDALNQDMPFDQFTIEQLAGDLLPDATSEQLVATGFLRNSPVATDVITHRFDMLVDRVNTLGSTWFGMTFSCAQCHDHKFDPLTQQEYYQLFAILNHSIDEVADAKYAGRTIYTQSPLTGETAGALVLQDRSEPNVTHLKVRGSPSVDGEQVEPGFPAFLHAPRCGEGDRLSLACWLTDESNPLTARVAVNRLWEDLFGVGLVRTSDDFGVRGEAPSHPELLDWLAVEYLRSGWSSKQIIRRLATSATYRQSSHRSAESQEIDPQNRLLAYGPRFRVSAELLRDIALSASGLLSENLGGPSVFPWQPPGTSENVEFASFPWNVNPDENQYRRGLYTHWKRRTLYPSFAMFDAPPRTSSCTRRSRTTNPLQALVSLNDPVFVEAAVYLGGRMLDETDGSPEAAISRGFRLCVGRHPTDHELSLLLSLHRQELSRLTRDIESALALIGGKALERGPDRDSAEWAACAVVANVLLSLDETMTRE